jgi:SSS family transporter
VLRAEGLSLAADSDEWLAAGRALGALLVSLAVLAATGFSKTLDWQQLPPLPDQEGYAGPFAGVDGQMLIVAGGANFPDRKPWEGGTKVWHNRAFVLEPGAASWKTGFQLPQPLAYGVSVSTDRGIACLGGSDDTRHYKDCFLMRWADGGLQFRPLPELPQPCANACGALVGTTIYVAGGTDRPGATTANKTHWALDLGTAKPQWKELEPMPGPGRMLATAGALNGAFYVFGGAALSVDADGKPVRQCLTDAYRYTPAEGWKRIADLPRPAVAAPTPAPALGQSHLVVLGGDDGSQIDVPPDEHQGFPREALAYHSITDTWVELEQLPFSLVTTPTAIWQSGIVVPGGEQRPGIRSNEVWSGRATARKSAFGWFNYATLFAYLVGVVAIGWICAKRNKSTEDYFKASGRIPWWAAGLSIYATMLSSLTFMAIPAKAFATDWTYFWANVPILLLAPFVIRWYVPFFRQLNVTSAYEFLEQRFNVVVRLYASTVFILFQLGRQAIVLLLPSLALAAVSDLDVTTSVLLMGALCVAYTTMGGIEAVIWTDVAQTAVLLGAGLVSLVLIVGSTDGGFSGLWATATEFDKLQMFHWTLDPTQSADAFWVIFIGSIFINLVPYTSDQTVVQRYMTTKDSAATARAIWTNGWLTIPSTVLFFSIGTALFVYFRSRPQEIDPVQPTDAIFPAFLVQNLPIGVAGVAIAGIFAAAQSTLSSSLNSVTAALMTDFYQRFGGTQDARRSLSIARWLTAMIGVCTTGAALLLARLNLASLWDAYLNLVGLAGGGLAGLFALGVFTRRANGVGALVGAATSTVVLYWTQQHTNVHFILYAGIGFVTCFVVGYLASLLLPATKL